MLVSIAAWTSWRSSSCPLCRLKVKTSASSRKLIFSSSPSSISTSWDASTSSNQIPARCQLRPPPLQSMTTIDSELASRTVPPKCLDAWPWLLVWTSTWAKSWWPTLATVSRRWRPPPHCRFELLRTTLQHLPALRPASHPKGHTPCHWPLPRSARATARLATLKPSNFTTSQPPLLVAMACWVWSTCPPSVLQHPYGGPGKLNYRLGYSFVVWLPLSFTFLLYILAPTTCQCCCSLVTVVDLSQIFISFLKFVLWSTYSFKFGFVWSSMTTFFYRYYELDRQNFKFCEGTWCVQCFVMRKSRQQISRVGKIELDNVSENEKFSFRLQFCSKFR